MKLKSIQLMLILVIATSCGGGSGGGSSNDSTKEPETEVATSFESTGDIKDDDYYNNITLKDKPFLGQSVYMTETTTDTLFDDAGNISKEVVCEFTRRLTVVAILGDGNFITHEEPAIYSGTCDDKDDKELYSRGILEMHRPYTHIKDFVGLHFTNEFREAMKEVLLSSKSSIILATKANHGLNKHKINKNGSEYNSIVRSDSDVNFNVDRTTNKTEIITTLNTVTPWFGEVWSLQATITSSTVATPDSLIFKVVATRKMFDAPTIENLASYIGKIPQTLLSPENDDNLQILNDIYFPTVK